MKKTEEYIRRLTTKGQVTVPVEIRRRLGVKPHDQIAFRVTGNRVELQPAIMTLESTFGAVKSRKRPEDFKELRDAAIEEHARKVAGELKD